MALFRALGSTFPSYVCRSKIVGRWGGKAAHSLRKMWRAFVHAEYFERRDLEGRDETGCTGSPHFAMSIEVRLLEPQFVSWMKWDEVAPVLDRNGGARSEMDHVIMGRKCVAGLQFRIFYSPKQTTGLTELFGTQKLQHFVQFIKHSTTMTGIGQTHWALGWE